MFSELVNTLLAATSSRDQAEQSQHCQSQTGRFWHDDQVKRSADSQFAGIFSERQVAGQIIYSGDTGWEDVSQIDLRTRRRVFSGSV